MSRNDKKITQDDYAILPDDDLKAKFKYDRRIQKIIALPMFVLIYCCVMLLPNLIDGSTVYGTLTFSAIVALIGYSFIFSDDPDNQKKAVKVTLTVLAVLVLPYLLEQKPVFLHVQLSYALVVIIPNVIARPYIKDIAVLKKHPRYPFDNWRRNDSYLSRTNYEGALRYMENAANPGKVSTVAGEEFLNGDVRTFELPKHDHEKDLQQREQVWRHHDKSDTSYTMDNLRNMYLGQADEGELSGKELERELMKATSPAKPPEPIPEEFFQSSPVVWRTRKDGTTVMERREAPSAPAGEHDSRSVLM